MVIDRPDASRLPWSTPAVGSLTEAILFTLSYADVFHYPLTLAELHRYLIGYSATPESIAAALQDMVGTSEQNGYYTLAGRDPLVPLREQRLPTAVAMWPRALAYGRAIARLPFVRMVALTGALPMLNVEPGDDFDYLIVTASERVWLTRFFIIQLVVKSAARRGDEVCPNFLLAEHALTLQERDLFHAHELAQMIPLYGWELYGRFRAANRWADAFLPNAVGPPRMDALLSVQRSVPGVILEWMLCDPVGGRLDGREMRRMQVKLKAAGNQEELVFSPDRCKGHLGAHAQGTQRAFSEVVSDAAITAVRGGGNRNSTVMRSLQSDPEPNRGMADD